MSHGVLTLGLTQQALGNLLPQGLSFLGGNYSEPTKGALGLLRKSLVVEDENWGWAGLAPHWASKPQPIPPG